MGTVEPIKKLQDIRKVEKMLAKKSYRDLLIFDFGINLGLRISDILNLNIEDVKNKTVISIQEKKTKKNKKIMLNSKIRKMISKYIKHKPINEPLFKNRFNKRLGRVSVYRILNSTCKNAGVNCLIGTHTLRKTFGYHHYKKFKDIAILQKIFNHSTPVVTLRYIGLDEDEIFKSYRNFIL